MSAETADAVICGAGIAGISAAYHLLVRGGLERVVLVDPLPPLSLTSDKSTECYRNWWPGPGDAMVRLMNRSIDLLEELARESGNYFSLNRRGYAYLTASATQAEVFAKGAEETSRLGAGDLRVHREGEAGSAPPDSGRGAGEGADLFLDPDFIRRRYPFVTPRVKALLEPRRCGWLSAQQLGMYLLEEASRVGLERRVGCVEEVLVEHGRVRGVRWTEREGSRLVETPVFVNAAGPEVARVGELLGVEIPVFHELHMKVTFDDHLRILPRDLPLMVWSDPVTLAWSEEERRELAADPSLSRLLSPLSGGVHFRPEGGADATTMLLLWAYDAVPREPVQPPPLDPTYPETVLRGLCQMVPAMEAYLEDDLAQVRRPYVDGGYYTKTRENRPLVGPLPVEGAFVLGALSGYGIMASQGAAELLAAHITGAELPSWAPAFHPARYEDPAYRALLAGWDAVAGQL